MRKQRDYIELLETGGVENTPNRLAVLEIVGNSASPLTAQEVYETLNRHREVNRVTVYRILEILVEKELLERISGGDRAFRYGMGVLADTAHHPHFYCIRCGNMECLTSEILDLDMDAFERTFTGEVQKVEIRIDGVCKNCLKPRKGA